MKSIHKPPTNYSCARCEEMSNARHNMNIHSISHGQELNIGCETCGYERKVNVNIKKHRQSHDRKLLTHVQNVSNKLKPQVFYTELSSFDTRLMSKITTNANRLD